MALLKAYLFNTKDPIRMFNSYLADLDSIAKAESNEELLDMMANNPRSGKASEIKAALEKIKNHKDIAPLFYQTVDTRTEEEIKQNKPAKWALDKDKPKEATTLQGQSAKGSSMRENFFNYRQAFVKLRQKLLKLMMPNKPEEVKFADWVKALSSGEKPEGMPSTGHWIKTLKIRDENMFPEVDIIVNAIDAYLEHIPPEGMEAEDTLPQGKKGAGGENRALRKKFQNVKKLFTAIAKLYRMEDKALQGSEIRQGSVQINHEVSDVIDDIIGYGATIDPKPLLWLKKLQGSPKALQVEFAGTKWEDEAREIGDKLVELLNAKMTYLIFVDSNDDDELTEDEAEVKTDNLWDCLNELYAQKTGFALQSPEDLAIWRKRLDKQKAKDKAAVDSAKNTLNRPLPTGISNKLQRQKELSKRIRFMESKLANLYMSHDHVSDKNREELEEEISMWEGVLEKLHEQVNDTLLMFSPQGRRVAETKWAGTGQYPQRKTREEIVSQKQEKIESAKDAQEELSAAQAVSRNLKDLFGGGKVIL
jgi:hypothetical protein